MPRKFFMLEILCILVLFIVSMALNLQSLMSLDIDPKNAQNCKPLFTLPHRNVRSQAKPVKFIGHNGSISSIIQLADGRIATGAFDNNIKIWNKDTGDCEMTLTADNFVQHLFQLPDGRLVSKLASRALRIWNLQTQQCELTSNITVFTPVFLQDGRMASITDNNTVEIWNTVTGVTELILSGHIGQIYGLVQLQDGRIVTSSLDSTVKFWNLLTGDCEKSFNFDGFTILDIEQLMKSQFLLFRISNDTIKIWNLATESFEDKLSFKATSVLQLKDDSLLVNYKGESFEFYNMTTQECDPWIFDYHPSDDSLYPILELQDGRIAFHDFDHINLFNRADGTEELIHFHSGSLTGSIQLNDGRLARGVGDDVMIWSVAGEECEITTAEGEKLRFISSPEEGIVSITAVRE